MPANCDDCEHRSPDGCYRGRALFPPKCGWFTEARAKQEQDADWEHEAEEECDGNQVPIAKCRWCGEWVPCHADDFERPKDGTRVRLWSCPSCDQCLNSAYDEDGKCEVLDFEPEWVTHEEAEARTGWKRVPPDEACQLPLGLKPRGLSLAPKGRNVRAADGGPA